VTFGHGALAPGAARPLARPGLGRSAMRPVRVTGAAGSTVASGRSVTSGSRARLPVNGTQPRSTRSAGAPARSRGVTTSYPARPRGARPAWARPADIGDLRDTPPGCGATLPPAMRSLIWLLIFATLAAILASLGFGLFHLSRGRAEDSRKLARALTIRITLSLV